MINRILLVAGAVLVFGVVNWRIASQERLRTGGMVAFLELAPLDPRSLMQGDYMALGFQVASTILETSNPEDQGSRVAILKLDPRRIASFARFDNGGPLAPDEIRFRVRLRMAQVWLGTDAFFFHEGEAERYRTAKYGEFHVSPSGEAMLVDLRGPNIEKL